MEQERPEVLRQYLTLFVATTAVFNFGAMLSYSSPAGVLLSDEDTSDLVLTYNEVGWLASSLEMGAFFGSLVGAVGLRKIGRKGVLLSAGGVGFIGWTLIRFADSKFVLMFGRFMCGILGGMSTLAESAYTAEIASPEIRGKIGTICPLMTSLGITFLATITLFVSSWRTLAAVFMGISFLQCVVTYFNYETPTYLLIKGKEREAKETLQKLRGRTYDISSELAEMKRLAERANQRFSTPLPWRKLKRPEVYKPFAICLILSCIIPATGFVPLISNLELIVQSTGASLDKLLGVSTIAYGAMRIVSTFLLLLLNDRIGRKKMTIITGTLTGLSLALFGLYFAILPNKQSWFVQLLGWIPFFSALFFIQMYRNMYFLYNAELLTPDVREICGLIVYATFCGANIVASITFFPLQELLPMYAPYWIYACVSFAGVLFTLLCIPETSGQSVETINLYFQKDSGLSKSKVRESLKESSATPVTEGIAILPPKEKFLNP